MAKFRDPDDKIKGTEEEERGEEAGETDSLTGCEKFTTASKIPLALFSMASWPTYSAGGGGIFTPKGLKIRV